jgi:two-component system sensor histidine kinase HydH
VGDIDEEIGRLNRIVSDVLDFAKPIKFELAQADLNALCRDAARAAGLEVEGDAGGAITLTLDHNLPSVVTDAERLRLVLVNLLTNARHAVEARTEPRQPVQLRTRRLGADRVAISIGDKGVGIGAENLSRIFEPYFTTKRGGSGLGLAIARNIIEGLGGSIAVVSRPGEGTDITLELPVTAGSLQPIQA